MGRRGKAREQTEQAEQTEDRNDVWREDASEQTRSGDEDQPATATQQQFVTPTTGDHPARVLSPSISTWGYSGQAHDNRTSPSRPSAFGTVFNIPQQPLQSEITSPLPRQLEQPRFLTRPEQKRMPQVGQGIPMDDPKPRIPTQEIPMDDPKPKVPALPSFTKGSTSKTITHGQKGQEDVRWIEQVAVERLRPISGPLQDLATRKDLYTPVYVQFYATQALHTLLKDPQLSIPLSDRVIEAIKIGGRYLSKIYGDSTKNEDRQLSPGDRAVLREVLDGLDDLLKNLDKYSDGRTTGFKLNKQRLVAFNKKLRSLRQEVEEGFVMEGEGIPKLPQWGLEGNANLFWSANDFEILGACYREDVTQFCIRIMAAYRALHSEESEEVAVPSVTQKQNEGEKKETKGRTTEEPNKSSMFRDAPISHYERVQTFTNQNASIFGRPSRNTASGKLASMLDSKPNYIASAPDPNDPGDDDDEDGGPRRPRKKGARKTGGPPGGPSGNNGSGRPPPGDDPSPDPAGGGGGNKVPHKPAIPQFDSKLKLDVIPTWDGNTDELGRWLIKINRLSERSEIVYKQLGYLAPTRLTGTAEQWYYSQSSSVRGRIEEDWGTLKNAIAAYYMNRTYLERQRARANKARYRQPGHYGETPSEYFIRKLELLEIVYNYSEGELINEIMAGAPSYWSTILAPHLYDSIENFQMAIKFQEDNLLRVGAETTRYRYDAYPKQENRNPFSRGNTSAGPTAKVNAVGWSKGVANPPFPKDDSNVSPRGTPEDKGGRPCRHCGSGKHWDPECKYARKGERKARVNALQSTPEEDRAQAEYDDLYYGLETDSDEENEEDFH